MKGAGDDYRKLSIGNPTLDIVHWRFEIGDFGLTLIVLFLVTRVLGLRLFDDLVNLSKGAAIPTNDVC